MLTVILSGGQSRRMGRDKAELPVSSVGPPILKTLVGRYSQLGQVAVSVNSPGRFETYGAREICDIIPDQGPLSGLHAALKYSGDDVIFLTACDLPNGDIGLAQRIAEATRGYDACIIRRQNGDIEPLFGAYGQGCADAAEQCLAEGRRSMRSLPERVNVRYLEESELEEFDLDQILLNVNTPEDYRIFLERRE